MTSKLRTIFCAVVCGTWVASAGPAAAEMSTAEDLFAVIALSGKPCGKVVNYSKLAERDYDVTCESGDRYRVYVKDERVVVQKR
jgi:hypothetical protein